MKLQRQTIAILLFLGSVLNTYAQTHFEEGYIIDLKNDTIYGFVDYKTDQSLHNLCTFKGSSSNAIVRYKPGEITGFSIKNRKFFISKEIEFEGKDKIVFLEFLLAGVVNLYFLDRDDQNFYFLEDESEMRLLSNEEIEVVRDDGRYLKESNRYKGVLRYTFQDYEGIFNQIEATDFDQRSLIKVTKNYHEAVCQEYDCIDYTKSTKMRYGLEVYGGMLITEAKLPHWEGTSSDTYTEFGINIRFKPAIAYYSWHILVGFAVSESEYFGRYSYEETIMGIPTTTTREFYYDLGSVRIPVTFEYHFTSGKLQPLLDIGVIGILNYKSESTSTLIYKQYSFGPEMRGDPLDENAGNFLYGLSVGTGVKYTFNNASYVLFKGRYEFDSYFDHITGFHSIGVSVGYGYNF